MTTALITGGAGFIGSHLAEALLALGWKVEVIDDLSTGGIDNIAHLKGNPHFSYILESVMNRSVMMELVDRADMVFHLAAAVGVRHQSSRGTPTVCPARSAIASTWSCRWPQSPRRIWNVGALASPPPQYASVCCWRETGRSHGGLAC